MCFGIAVRNDAGYRAAIRFNNACPVPMVSDDVDIHPFVATRRCAIDCIVRAFPSRGAHDEGERHERRRGGEREREMVMIVILHTRGKMQVAGSRSGRGRKGINKKHTEKHLLL